MFDVFLFVLMLCGTAIALGVTMAACFAIATLVKEEFFDR